MRKALKVQRRELKYYIRYSDYLVLSDVLKRVMSRDPHSLEGGYFVRSLYFDDLDDGSFHQKIAGIEDRKKFRLRIYDTDAKMVKFEIKNKLNNTIFKESAWIKKADAVRVQNRDYDVLLRYNNPVLNKIYSCFKKVPFRPVVLVDYRREAFIYPFNRIRVTFDKRLKSSSAILDCFDESSIMRPALNDNLVIMEVKYDGFIPNYLKSILQSYVDRFTFSAISKYCVSRLVAN